jgi:hypothetical protein
LNKEELLTTAENISLLKGRLKQINNKKPQELTVIPYEPCKVDVPIMGEVLVALETGGHYGPLTLRL